MRCGITANCVKNVIIWGNHSSTQYPDVHHCKVNVQGKDVAAFDAVKDDAWLKGDFISVSAVCVNILFLWRSLLAYLMCQASYVQAEILPKFISIYVHAVCFLILQIIQMIV